jgi:hypothetical protein
LGFFYPIFKISQNTTQLKGVKAMSKVMVQFSFKEIRALSKLVGEKQAKKIVAMRNKALKARQIHEPVEVKGVKVLQVGRPVKDEVRSTRLEKRALYNKELCEVELDLSIVLSRCLYLEEVKKYTKDEAHKCVVVEIKEYEKNRGRCITDSLECSLIALGFELIPYKSKRREL